MEKLWLKNYQAGVDQEIDIEQFQSLTEMFDLSIKTFQNRPALACMGKELNYQQLDTLSAHFASYLQNQLKLRRGDRVAVMMPNLLQYPIVVFGALRAGCTIVNVNPLYTPRELEYQLNDSGAETIIILENFANVLEKVLPRTQVRNIIVASLGDLLGFPKQQIVNFVVRKIKKLVPAWQFAQFSLFNDALKQGAKQSYNHVDTNHDDIAFLQYTGGTTGTPKAAMLLHKNIIANMLQASAWVKPCLREGQEIIVTALPLYHIFSLTANLMLFTKIGALNVLIPNPRDIAGFIKEMRKYPVSCLTGVNTLFNALLNHPDFAILDFSTWRMTLGGGMAVQKTVADKWKQLTGTTLIEAYGLTETSPAACINPMNLANYNGTIGLPIPSTDIELRDSDGKPVAQGEQGELCIRGPQVMKGYWNRPDETAKVLDEQGFLATGDIAVLGEDGFVKLVDRKKDMILVSGFNVYPNEIEDVIASHPDVLEVACVGVPDDKSGEAVKVFIVKKNTALSEQAILHYCREKLTAYKVPKLIEFRSELPKTNVGKILRRALRE
ncbi:long-chain-fatty-acid--CoA ligase [Neisseriaceae bacterium TC5R-5]|nr:long-chain-fatty-acid--CoA ligase [Neisseriaceae bacterium TC5R-5]